MNILKPTKLYTLKSKRCGLWIIISQKKKRERKKKKKKFPYPNATFHCFSSIQQLIFLTFQRKLKTIEPSCPQNAKPL